MGLLVIANSPMNPTLSVGTYDTTYLCSWVGRYAYKSYGIAFTESLVGNHDHCACYLYITYYPGSSILHWRRFSVWTKDPRPQTTTIYYS